MGSREHEVKPCAARGDEPKQSRGVLRTDRKTKTGGGFPPTRQKLSRKAEGFGVIAYRFEPDGIHR